MGKRKPKERSLDFGSPTGFRDKRGAAKDVAARSYARRSNNLSAAENTRLLGRYAQLKDGPNGKKEGVADLAAEFGVDAHFITHSLLPRALDDQRDEAPLAYQVDKREPVIFTEDVDAFMVDQGLKWDGEFSWQEMADAVNKEYGLPVGVPSASGTRKHCIEKAGWVDTKQSVLPWLTEPQKAARATWAKKNGRNKFMAWVDVDEKWFFTVKLHGRRKRQKGQKLPPRFCKSKTNIPKVMFLSAVARPRPGFDGRIGKGLWRVAAKKTAKRRSKNHERDEEFDEDTTMTSELYFKLMRDSVFPAIVSAFAGQPSIKTVVVQQDGARPHTGKDVVGRLNAIGATLTPKLEVRTQPAQSPDMNVNDLALFRGLDVLVRKARRGQGNEYDKEKLVADVSGYSRRPPSTPQSSWSACGSTRSTSWNRWQVHVPGGNDYTVAAV